MARDHPLQREILLRVLPEISRIHRVSLKVANASCELRDGAADVSGNSVTHDLRHRAAGSAKTGVAQAMGSTINKPNGLVHFIRNSMDKEISIRLFFAFKAGKPKVLVKFPIR